MATRYPVTIPGFENETIDLESSGFFRPARLFVNGKKADAGKKNNEVILRKSDGSTTSVFFQNAFFDTVPRLLVSGKTIQVASPLTWYQYIYSGLLLFLIFVGGVVGAVLGMVAFILNIRIMRGKLSTPLKYLSILGIHIATFFIYIALSLLVTVMTGQA